MFSVLFSVLEFWIFLYITSRFIIEPVYCIRKILLSSSNAPSPVPEVLVFFEYDHVKIRGNFIFDREREARLFEKSLEQLQKWIYLNHFHPLSCLKNNETIPFFQQQSIKAISQKVLVELFSIDRDTRLKELLRYLCYNEDKAEAKRTASSIVVLILTFFGIPLMGKDEGQNMLMELEEVPAILIGVLFSSHNSFLCDFMLQHLTNSAIGNEIISKHDLNTIFGIDTSIDDTYITNFLNQVFMKPIKKKRTGFLKTLLGGNNHFKRNLQSTMFKDYAENILKDIRLFQTILTALPKTIDDDDDDDDNWIDKRIKEQLENILNVAGISTNEELEFSVPIQAEYQNFLTKEQDTKELDPAKEEQRATKLDLVEEEQDNAVTDTAEKEQDDGILDPVEEKDKIYGQREEIPISDLSTGSNVSDISISTRVSKVSYPIGPNNTAVKQSPSELTSDPYSFLYTPSYTELEIEITNNVVESWINRSILSDDEAADTPHAVDTEEEDRWKSFGFDDFDRDGFVHFFSNLPQATFSNVKEFRKKMGLIKQTFRSLTSDTHVRIFNQLLLLSKALPECIDILEELQIAYKKMTDQYVNYRRSSEEFELGFTVFGMIEFANSYKKQIRLLFNELEKGLTLGPPDFDLIYSTVCEGTQVMANLKHAWQMYVKSSSAFKKVQEIYQGSIDNIEQEFILLVDDFYTIYGAYLDSAGKEETQ